MSGADIQAIYDRRAEECRQTLKELDAKASAKAKGTEKPQPVTKGFNPKYRTHNTLTYCDIFTQSK